MLDELNAQQREVVETQGHCEAIACPGAGKTKTIATKAALLLGQRDRYVGAVTFSKDAALELRARILTLSGDSGKRRLVASTFHSLAFKQIRADRSQQSDVASEGDRQGLLAGVLQDLDIDWTVEDATALIEKIKTNFGKVDRGTPEASLYAAYQDALMRNGKLDFQDMLRLAVEGMETGRVKPYPFTDLLVDEFQDTDPLQYRWVQLHAEAGATVTIVGDDDQSIYGFRSALGYRGMQSFAAEFNAQQIVLGSNYRCRSEILTAADTVIRKNVERIPKVLHAAKGAGGHISASRFQDEYAEAVAAVEELAPHLARGASAAILARTNRILDPIEAVCRSHGVPYFRASGYSILNRPEGAVMCNLLAVIQGAKTNGLDNVLAFCGVSTRDLRLLHSKMGASLEQQTKANLIDLGLAEATATGYRDFMKRMGEWKALCARQFYSLILDGVVEWLSKFANKDAAERAIRGTYDVLSRLSGSFTERIEFLRQDNNEPVDGALVLTTMHGSKGLEWDHVWIARAEEAVVPDEKSPESEERRLFYVAMTRARESLMVTMTKRNPISRFALEAGLSIK
ncbi:DNA 3'-5' helicase (plasmid) [Pararobbsia alpina]|uniref:ATP-dependent helicase n=1 Tax=Pararobbsia alpina TaxID=621374 RepID=UPI0039A507FC